MSALSKKKAFDVQKTAFDAVDDKEFKLARRRRKWA
jgi:hypothetical protein